MASISGQPSPKPQSVGSPVPGDELAQAAAAFMAKNKAPVMEAPAEAPQEDLVSAASQFVAQQPTGADNVVGPTGEMQTDEQAYGAKLSEAGDDGKGALADRIRYGLAANDQEAVNALRSRYGDKNVVVKKGEIYFRRQDKGEMKRIDPDTFELAHDLLTDNARTAVTEAAMLPVEMLGGVAGAAAGAGAGGATIPVVGAIPGSAAGAVTGARLARVGMVPFANMAADKIAELAGVPQDEGRSKTSENLLGMGAEFVLPVIGSKLMKRIPGTAAYKLARDLGERETIALSRQSKEVVEAANRLNAEGIDAPLLLHQMQPDDPKVKKLLSDAGNSGQLIQKEMEIAEGYGQSLKKVLGSIASQGKNAPSGDTKNLSQGIIDAVSDIDRLEGEAIGKFKAKAMALAKGRKVPLPQTANQTVETMMRELGFTPKKEVLNSVTRREVMNPILEQTQQMGRRNEIVRTKWTPPKDMDGILGRFGITDPGQARAIVNNLKEYSDVMSRGGEVRLPDLDKLINRMGAINPKLRGTEAGKLWGGLTGELRQHRRKVIGDLLDNGADDFEKKAFNDAMDNFSLIRQNVGDLQGVLGDNRSTKSIVNFFFSGKDNVPRIDALKAIVGKDSPQWGQLKEEFVNQLLVKHADANSKTGFNSGKLLKDLEQGYGPDFMKKIMNEGSGPNYQTVKDLLTYGQRLEAAERGIKNVDDASETVKKGIGNLAISMWLGLKGQGLSAMKSIVGAGSNQERALMEILSRDGVDKYIKDYPGKMTNSQKASASKFFSEAVERYNTQKRADAVKRTLQGVGRVELSRDRSDAQDTPTAEAP